MKADSERMKSLAKRLRYQANNLKMDNFLSFIYASEMLNKYMDIKLKGYGLNKTQLSILHMLIIHGGTMIPTEISVRLPRSIHATARSIDSLDKLGLTKSSATKLDRRLRKVSITEKGLDLIEETTPNRQKICNQVMSCLEKEESEAFQNILRRLRQHVLHLMGET